MKKFFLALSLLFLISASQADDKHDFFVAVSTDRADLVEDLVKKGFDPNTADEQGNTGLIVAMHENSNRVLEYLVNLPGIDLDHKAKNGNTALMLAAWKENVPAAKLLVEKGALVHHFGWTPLHYAAAVGNVEIMTLLLNEGAVVDALSPNTTTPLMMAARSGHNQAAILLIEHGADVSLKNHMQFTAIRFAKEGEFKSLQEILEKRLKEQQGE